MMMECAVETPLFISDNHYVLLAHAAVRQSVGHGFDQKPVW